ncbi:MAG: lytic transglycosylase domain-containing protein, partial [Acidimicrobiales bacterium]
HGRAVADEVRRTGELTHRQANVDQARALAGVVGADFPLVALDAYWRAARHLAAGQPACGISWWALAGIARVESRHGTSRGSTLLPDGDTTAAIIGIPLDGTNGTASVPDTDGGAMDGDPVVDRAVGPMQFIPTTWRRWARDGNGDGLAMPHNLYDAAVTAARFLCAGGPLTDDAGLRAAFLRYNQSEEYVETVLGWARGYAGLPAPPVGSTG